MAQRLLDRYHRHAAFVHLWLLAISFRLLALLLFRPGGFITDFSDYDFYATWGTLGPMGYRAYDNLWTAYPPLFPLVMLNVYEWAARIPPWTEPRLFFHLLFGLVLLCFEAGNLLLIYRLAGRLASDEATAPPAGYSSPGLAAVAFYALCFVPVYTLLGWFESMPLFFLLLGLELLLMPRAWGWLGSGFAAGLGFLTKLTPILLLPVAIRWLGARLSWDAARREWFNPRSPRNLLRPTLYVLLFAAVVAGVGYPLVRANPSLALSSFRIQSIRSPWQSVWALIDGSYEAGVVALDMRNLEGLAASLWQSNIPWTWVGLGFLLIYLWLYTRPYDWARIRTPLAFTATSVILLFLYSKGWSPQFLVWVLAFLALLLPTLRGVILAIFLSLINVVESHIFLIMLPNEHWLMVGTVIARTLLLLLLMVEFTAQIWPAPARAANLQRLAAWSSWGVVLAALIGAGIATPRVASAYWDQQLAAHPCREAIRYLEEEAGWPNDLIVTQQPELWRDLYPWLREAYEFYVIDGYVTSYEFQDEALRRVNEIVDQEFWWISRDDMPYSRESPREVHDHYFNQPDVFQLEERIAGNCRLERVIRIQEPQPQAAGAQPVRPLATAAAAGGPIVLDLAALTPVQVGGTLRLVLYWHAQAPVTARYTVFTQLFDPAGTLVAQQDNWPVAGLAPTDTWQPGALIRDPYQLSLPEGSSPGTYQLLVGLYDEHGRRTLTLANGSEDDHLVLPVFVE
ncbi:MAG: hypothetical protein IT328_11695 [Caldilineaceae bacterium]|nr:hypothetical protein [Caldilineaceae bacterium]